MVKIAPSILSADFGNLAGEINAHMPSYVVERITKALNEHRKPINGSRIGILGVAYKKDIDDPRESPAFKLMELLQSRGAILSYNDPFVPRIPRMRRHDLHMASQELTGELLERVDCVLLATDHSQYDYKLIGQHAQLIVDTRNAMVSFPQYADNVWKA